MHEAEWLIAARIRARSTRLQTLLHTQAPTIIIEIERHLLTKAIGQWLSLGKNARRPEAVKEEGTGTHGDEAEAGQGGGRPAAVGRKHEGNGKESR